MKAQRPKSVKGPVWLSIGLTAPTKRKYDLDNRVKGLIDLLVNHQVIEADDNTIVRKLLIYVYGGAIGAHITVTPESEAV